MRFEAIQSSRSESAPASSANEIGAIVRGRKVAVGRLEAGRALAPVARALGRTGVWDGTGQRVIVG